MRKNNLLPGLILAIIVAWLPNPSFGQGNQGYADLYFYRPKQSVASGAVAVEIKVSLNEQEIGTLLNKTKMRYRLYSQGPIKVKCAGMLGGSGISSPYSQMIHFEHGKEYHIVLAFHPLRGVAGEIISGNKINRYKKGKYADAMELEEDSSNPVLALPSGSNDEVAAGSYASLYVYRPKQSMTKGGVAVELKVSLNDQEIGSLLNKTKLRYRLYSQGPIRVKSFGVLQSGGIGSPYVKAINFEHGKEYHVVLSFSASKGVKGKILSGSKAEKMKKQKFADFTELEENMARPIVGGKK